MSAEVSRQSRKRRATRQKIAEVATRLFFERGFDVVTTGEIAEAADVTRMTVFNHFPRKEDLFFDLDESIRGDMRRALHGADAGLSPIEAIRLFVHRAFTEEDPYAGFLEEKAGKFMATVQASDALKNRARAIRDELTDALAVELAARVGRAAPDSHAKLAASLLLSTLSVAIVEARSNHAQGGDPAAARTLFLRIADQGLDGITAALKGTAYASRDATREFNRDHHGLDEA